MYETTCTCTCNSCIKKKQSWTINAHVHHYTNTVYCEIHVHVHVVQDSTVQCTMQHCTCVILYCDCYHARHMNFHVLLLLFGNLFIVHYCITHTTE